MLSETLSSLKEIKAQLQLQLAQRPEYRALLIIDEAALQLAKALDPLNPAVATPSQSAVEKQPLLTILAAEPADAIANREQREDRLQDAAVEMTAAIEEPPAPSLSPAALPDAPDRAEAPAPESDRTQPRAIDLFLSSTAQAANLIVPPPRPRSYLPFVAASRRVVGSKAAALFERPRSV